VLHAAPLYRTQKFTKNSPKNSPSAHHCTRLSGYIFATSHVSTIGEIIVKQQYLLHMSSQYGNFGPLTAEIGWQV